MKTSFICLSLFAVLLLSNCSNKQTAHNQTAGAEKNIPQDTTNSNKKEPEKQSAYKTDIQKIALSPDISAFIPAGFSIMDTARGDLNLDGLNDLILVLKQNNEAELADSLENPVNRPLILLLGKADNTFEQARRNDQVVYCLNCGGIWGDPYNGITIKNGYFSVEHYGGSNWRWTRIITFKYSAKDKEWYLHKDGGDTYHTSDPDKVETKVQTTKDFGIVKFAAFDVYKDR
jgi:hypothetical protein